MLKRISNTLSNIRREDDCIPHRDCTAHDAAAEDLAIAKSNLLIAQNNLTNAEALRDSLQNEMNEVQDLLADCQKSYDLISDCGPAVQRPDILGDGQLSGMLSCVSSYGESVEAAHSQAVSEVSRCQSEVARCEVEVTRASVRLANTPCVWVC